MKISNFIICDDIRSELGNKHSLIGVYDGVIEFNVSPSENGKWPKVLKLGLFARFIAESEDEKKKISRVRIKMESNGIEKSLVESSFNSNTGVLTPKINLAIVFNQFFFESAGELTFTFEFYDASGNLISSIKSSDKLKVTEKLIS
jgi:hypothetical protein